MAAIRTAVLSDGSGKWLGTTQVPEATILISHDDVVFCRTEKGVRLSGGGIGVIFTEVEPLVRNQLGRV